MLFRSRSRVLSLGAALAPPPDHHTAPLGRGGHAGDALHLEAHHAALAPGPEGAKQPALPLAQPAPAAGTSTTGAMDDAATFRGAHWLVVQEVELLRQEGGRGVVVRLASYHVVSWRKRSSEEKLRLLEG